MACIRLIASARRSASENSRVSRMDPVRVNLSMASASACVKSSVAARRSL
jgi:hypothetical protein